MAHGFNSESCFIISPIGKANDAVRTHVERVRVELIDAALKVANDELGTNLRAFRADMKLEAGHILEAVLQSILSAQLLFVVLTHDMRPNVYYELGVAHSAARPVIILKDKRIRREFDIYHFQTIGYSLGDQDGEGAALPVEIPVASLAEIIVATYRKGEPEVAFQNSKIDPLNKQNANITLYNRFSDISYPDWSRLMNRAKRSIDLLGTTLLDLSKIDNDGFLRGDGEKGVALVDYLSARILFDEIDVTVTMMHEDNPSLESMLKGSRAGVDIRFVDQVRQEIEWSTRRWQDMARRLEAYDATTIADIALPRQPSDVDLPRERRGTFRLLKVRHGHVKFRLTLTDHEVLATPILYRHGRNGSGPAFRVRSSVPMYNSLKSELDHLKEANEDSVVVSVGPGSNRKLA